MDTFMTAFDNVIYAILGVVWHDAICWYNLAAGLLFTILLKGAQFRYLPRTLRMTFGSRKEDSSSGISNWSGLMMTVGGRVGTGNIVGVAAAIAAGGPGAVFWMWMVALLGSAASFVESTLAQIYKNRSEEGQYYGGQAYYAEKALGIKWYAGVIAVILLLANVFGNPTVQANTIAGTLASALNVPAIAVGIVLTALLAFVIFGGIRRLSECADKLVPVMCVIYFAVATILVVANAAKVPATFALIFRSAFSAKSAFGGIMGAALSWGVRRGVYSSEAGQGAGSAAAAAVDASHPCEQGMAQALSVFIDTIIVCTLTALCILVTGCYNVAGADGSMIVENLPGMESSAFVQQAVSTVLPFGQIIVALLLTIFAFTSLMNYYYQAETALVFMLRKRNETAQKSVVNVMRICFCAMVLVSSSWTSQRVWNLCDVGGGLLTWSHLTLILLICGPAVKALRDYDRQIKAGIEKPIFDPIKLKIKNADLWTKINAERAAGKE